MSHFAAFHLGLHCLPKYSFRFLKNVYKGLNLWKKYDTLSTNELELHVLILKLCAPNCMFVHEDDALLDRAISLIIFFNPFLHEYSC